MTLQFLGGAKSVTGAQYLLEHEGTRVLVDCGLFQGGAATEQLNAEPFGFEEILRGATHRANAVTEKFGRNIVAVGIENGILGPDPLESNIVKGVNLDIAVIVVLAYGKRIVTNSSSIQLPFSEVMVARVIGFDTTTVGQIIADKFGSDPADPHSHLTRGRISRKDLLVRALVVAFQQIYPEDLATAPV